MRKLFLCEIGLAVATERSAIAVHTATCWAVCETFLRPPLQVLDLLYGDITLVAYIELGPEIDLYIGLDFYDSICPTACTMMINRPFSHDAPRSL